MMRLKRAHAVCLICLVLVAGCSRDQGAKVADIPAPAPTELDAIGSQNEARESQAMAARFAALPVAEQTETRAAAAAFNALPSDKKQKLREEFASLDDVAQRGYLLGPSLGEAWPHLQPVFGYVPDEERNAVLTMLRSMDREQLFMLERLAWRTPVEDRDSLRKKVLGLAPSERRAWLFDQNH